MRWFTLFVLLLLVSPLAGAEFQGWQGMRVIQLDGQPERMLVADLDGNGRDEVILVNSRQARLDLYRWLPEAERKQGEKPDPMRPNELPLAPEWSRSELAIDELPLDAVAHDVNHDGKLELLVFTSPSNKIVVYSQSPAKAKDDKTPAAKAIEWKKTSHWDLLAGAPTGRGKYLQVRELGTKHSELLISYEQGIQQLALEPAARANWLSPRESRGRLDWRLIDLDGDHDLDLVEWSAQARQTVRWYECAKDKKLLPAQALYEHAIDGFDVLRRHGQPGELLILGGSTDGLLRRYQLARGETSELGRQDALPLSGDAKAGWCGIKIDDKPAIVALDTTQPRLRLHVLGTDGWLAEQTFPTISGIRGLVAPPAEPGRLLIWTKDASELYRSKWENGRLSYPQLWPQEAGAADRKILTLETVGDTTWWAQRAGNDLDLFIWPVGRPEADKRRFTGVGAKAEKVVWLGGDRILLQESYATSAKLVAIKDGKTSSTALPQLGKVDLGEYQLYPVDGKLKAARLTDGVLQWLGDDLQPTDQIMLTEGQKLSSYVPLKNGEAWALEQGGAFMHRLKPDSAGIPRVVESVKPPTGSALRSDAILGVMLLDANRIVRLSQGKPWELKLVDSIDSRVGRPSGVRESTIHRILSTDLDGDGTDEVILCDDRRHQLTALQRTDTGLRSVVTWQVFEDQKYPYGDSHGGGLVTEPRRLLSFNADGDSIRDLTLISQDRLILYLGKD